MSIPNYYRDGVGASAQMKADLKRVRLAKPERYVGEQPDASVPPARLRHDFWTRRAK